MENTGTSTNHHGGPGHEHGDEGASTGQAGLLERLGLPASTLGRPLSEFVPPEALPVYDFGPRKVGRLPLSLITRSRAQALPRSRLGTGSEEKMANECGWQQMTVLGR